MKTLKLVLCKMLRYKQLRGAVEMIDSLMELLFYHTAQMLHISNLSSEVASTVHIIPSEYGVEGY